MSAGLYIHFPYCRRRCYYCDFAIHVNPRPKWKEYIDRLLEEWQIRHQLFSELNFDTVYLGGGTPSMCPIDQLERLRDGLKATWGQATEISLEANPEDIVENPKLLSSWESLGINRLSLGIQSFSDSALQSSGRSHDQKTALESLRLIGQSPFVNYSIDIICGLETESEETWQTNLDIIQTFLPPHISVYHLTIEANTPLAALVKRGKAKPCSDQVLLNQWDFMRHKLKNLSYHHYELSNYCQSGLQSRHNQKYWSGHTVIGLGNSATSWVSPRDYEAAQYGIRWTNPKKLNDYQKEPFLEPQSFFLDQKTYEHEFWLSRWRSLDGINWQDITRHIDPSHLNHAKQTLDQLIEKNLIILKKDRYLPTEKGLRYLDEIPLSFYL